MTIAVIGDSLADGIWGGLYRKLYRDKRFCVHRGAKNSVGFGASDMLEPLDRAFEAGPVDAVVMMIGANDRRGIYGSDGTLAAACRRPPPTCCNGSTGPITRCRRGRSERWAGACF